MGCSTGTSSWYWKRTFMYASFSTTMPFMSLLNTSVTFGCPMRLSPTLARPCAMPEMLKVAIGTTALAGSSSGLS